MSLELLSKYIKLFKEAKAGDNKERVIYYKGFCEGIMKVLLENKMATKEDIKKISALISIVGINLSKSYTNIIHSYNLKIMIKRMILIKN